jgi:hypothetical protein
MLAGPPDHVPPQPDLDATAACAAEARYRAALAANMPERAAWDEAVELFRMHHPAWPLPLAESEAARAVGGLIGARRTIQMPAEVPATRAAPLSILRRLARPASSGDFAMTSGEHARRGALGPAPVRTGARAVAASASPG